MKKLSILFVGVLLMAAGAMAAIPTGFNLDNEIGVEGDWMWDGSSWTLPSPAPVTANFHMKISSPLATTAQFSEVVTLGAPWHLNYDSQASVMAPVKFTNELTAITVNPPSTTPGTAWTKVHFVESSGSVFSGATLTVNGYGDIYVKSVYNMEDSGVQVIDLNIN